MNGPPRVPLTIKICGLNSEDALDAALEAGADLVGFVFFPPSPRNLDLGRARALGTRVAGRAGKVALTVDADDRLLADIVDALRPDMLQLHGREPPDRLAAIRSCFGLPVMTAIPVATGADLRAVEGYLAAADRLLFDARAPQEATRPGGLGTPFDWRLLADFEAPIPYMLSGGLDPENVAEALAITRAPGIDVSSGVERRPGEKDVARIRAFIDAARRAVGDRAAPAVRRAS